MKSMWQNFKKSNYNRQWLLLGEGANKEIKTYDNVLELGTKYRAVHCIFTF